MIFQKSVIDSFKQDDSLVATRWAAFQNYKTKIEAIKDFKEEEYQDGFLKDIFENCLGYILKTTNPNSYNLEREKKNETDSKKADGVIYLDSLIKDDEILEFCKNPTALKSWFSKYENVCLEQNSSFEVRFEIMKRVNPKYILKNYII